MKPVDFIPKADARSDGGIISVSISKKGAICFSKGACELLSLHSGDEIVFSGDEENSKSWFVRKGSSGSNRKITLRQNSAKNPRLQTNCVSWTSEIFKNLKTDDKNNVRMLISKEPEVFEGVKYYPIILSSAK